MTYQSDALSPEVILRAQGVGFSYGSVPVLDGLDLTIERGTSTAIMGQSGAGKSTLLQLLAGMKTPTTGEVLLGSQPFSALPERQRDALRLRHLGFVFQFGELLPELTITENVELPLLFLGERRSQARMRAGQMLAAVDLSGEAERRLSDISGGQLQRAAIARALVHRPSVVFADEPTGSLDEETGRQILDLLIERTTEQASVVVVTHSADVAARCDRVLKLARGSVEAAALR